MVPKYLNNSEKLSIRHFSGGRPFLTPIDIWLKFAKVIAKSLIDVKDEKIPLSIKKLPANQRYDRELGPLSRLITLYIKTLPIDFPSHFIRNFRTTS